MTDAFEDRYNLMEKLQNKIEENRRRLSHTLDMLVAYPLMFTEVPEHARLRKQGYGQLSDYREKPYGIEYRTTPSWMGSEKLAKGVLSLAYATAHDVLNKDYNPKNFTLINGFRDNYKIHNTDLLQPFLERAEKEIKSLSLYPKYKEEIGYILYHAKRGTELFDTEVKLGWGIPFTMLTNLTLLTVKELVEKVSLSLSIPRSRRHTTGINTVYVSTKTQDYMIPQIRDNINVCLNTVINQSNQNRKAIALYAKKREYGNIVDINYSWGVDMTRTKRNQLVRLIQSVSTAFGFTEPIQVNLRSSYEEVRANGVTQIARVGLGRKIREQHDYLSEAIVFTILLFLNDSLYQGYTVDRRTGKRTTKPITARTIVGQFKKNLVGKAKRVPSPTEDREEAQEEEHSRSRYYNQMPNYTSTIRVPHVTDGASIASITTDEIEHHVDPS